MAAFPLSEGSKGNEVRTVQRYLNTVLSRKGKARIAVDGDFGPKTRAALVDTFGHLRSAPQVSRRLYDWIVNQLGTGASTPPDQAAGRSSIEDMNGEELMKFIAGNDLDSYRLLLTSQEMLRRVKATGDRSTATQQREAALTRRFRRYQARQQKINTSTLVKVQRTTLSGYEWLRDAWSNAISGGPLIPIAWAAGAVVLTGAGFLVYNAFKSDGYESISDREELVEIESYLRDRLPAQDFQYIIDRIKDADQNAYEAGRTSFSFGSAAPLIGLALIAAIATKRRRNEG